MKFVQTCSMQWLFWQISKKRAPLMESFSANFAKLWLYKKAFHERCFLKSFVKYFRAAILQNTSEWLLQIIVFQCWNFSREIFSASAPLIKGTLLVILNLCVRNVSRDGCCWLIYFVRKHAWQQGSSCWKEYFEMWSVMLWNCVSELLSN